MGWESRFAPSNHRHLPTEDLSGGRGYSRRESPEREVGSFPSASRLSCACSAILRRGQAALPLRDLACVCCRVLPRNHEAEVHAPA